MSRLDSCLDAIRDALGAVHVRHREDRPEVPVVQPGTAGEVAAALRLCAASGLSVVPEGGRTGAWSAAPRRAPAGPSCRLAA